MKPAAATAILVLVAIAALAAWYFTRKEAPEEVREKATSTVTGTHVDNPNGIRPSTVPTSRTH